MILDISSFLKALSRLEEGLVRYQADVSDAQLRDGLIQRFEFTYELAYKTIRRYLEGASPTPGEFDGAEFAFVIRSAAEQNLLLRDLKAWKRYRELRGKTSHTYDEDVAVEVVEGIPAFLEEARYLRDELKKRLLR